MLNKESLNQVAVCVLQAQYATQARQLAQDLDLPIIDCAANTHDLLLAYADNGLTLRDVNSGSGAVFVDFIGGAVGHRYRQGIGRKEPLARAVGIKAHQYPTVLDATAGLGRDAFVLASLGCQVHLLERSPIVAALLADGLCRAKADAEMGDWLSQRLSLTHCDALLWMREHPNAYHSVYLDPMYPHRRKSALVKKEMQVLRLSVGADVDAAALLEAALYCAQKRVVVKRPKGAECLDARQPQAQIGGKTTRFDLYLKESVKRENTYTKVSKF